jgi:hypothetical protein
MGDDGDLPVRVGTAAQPLTPPRDLYFSTGEFMFTVRRLSLCSDLRFAFLRSGRVIIGEGVLIAYSESRDGMSWSLPILMHDLRKE